MGWSCTKKAGDTLKRLQARIDAEQKRKMQCEFQGLGNTYFWEVDTNKEFPDGHIEGGVFAMALPGFCSKAGTFKIDAQGHIKRFPGLPKAWINTLNAFADGEMFVCE
jgi:hypothetical protein